MVVTLIDDMSSFSHMDEERLNVLFDALKNPLLDEVAILKSLPVDDVAEVAKSPFGLGLFAATAIPKGAFIGVYSGQIIDDSQFYWRCKMYREGKYVEVAVSSSDASIIKRFCDENLFDCRTNYIMHIGRAEIPRRIENIDADDGIPNRFVTTNVWVDSTVYGSKLRFLNTSHSNADVNSKYVMVRYNGAKNIGLQAMKDIKPGKEILVSGYSAATFYVDLAGEFVKCNCGRSSCWGYIGVGSKEELLNMTAILQRSVRDLTQELDFARISFRTEKMDIGCSPIKSSERSPKVAQVSPIPSTSRGIEEENPREEGSLGREKESLGDGDDDDDDDDAYSGFLHNFDLLINQISPQIFQPIGGKNKGGRGCKGSQKGKINCILQNDAGGRCRKGTPDNKDMYWRHLVSYHPLFMAWVLDFDKTTFKDFISTGSKLQRLQKELDYLIVGDRVSLRAKVEHARRYRLDDE